jgi:hypothetical protein
MKQRALIAVTKEIFLPLKNPASLIDPIQSINWIKFQTKYGIKLPTSTQICLVISVVNLVNFEVYKLSLLGKRHMIQFFRKKHVKDTR